MQEEVLTTNKFIEAAFDLASRMCCLLNEISVSGKLEDEDCERIEKMQGRYIVFSREYYSICWVDEEVKD